MAWYDDRKNLIEFAEFMVESDHIESIQELLEYMRHPEKYTEAWESYQEEIYGKTRPNLTCKPVNVSDLEALVHPSSQCVVA